MQTEEPYNLIEKKEKQIPLTRISVYLLYFVGSVFFICCSKGNSNSGSQNSSNLVNYTGSFVKSNPADTTTATGSIQGTLDKTNLGFKFEVSWHHLTSIPVEMHFHDAGPVIIQVNGWTVTTDGTYSGTVTFNSAQASDLAAGSIYFMIHTQNYTDGEVKATLLKQ